MNTDLIPVHEEAKFEEQHVSRNVENNDNVIYKYPKSGNATPALSYIGANEEIKEEFREDSESSNEFIS